MRRSDESDLLSLLTAEIQAGISIGNLTTDNSDDSINGQNGSGYDRDISSNNSGVLAFSSSSNESNSSSSSSESNNTNISRVSSIDSDVRFTAINDSDGVDARASGSGYETDAIPGCSGYDTDAVPDSRSGYDSDFVPGICNSNTEDIAGHTNIDHDVANRSKNDDSDRVPRSNDRDSEAIPVSLVANSDTSVDSEMDVRNATSSCSVDSTESDSSCDDYRYSVESRRVTSDTVTGESDLSDDWVCVSASTDGIPNTDDNKSNNNSADVCYENLVETFHHDHAVIHNSISKWF